MGNKFRNNLKMKKKIHFLTPAQYTGIPEPSRGINSSVSFHQLAHMSERAKNDRVKCVLLEKNKERNSYKEAEKQWEKDLLISYKKREFSLKDVVNFNENNAFYVIVKEVCGNEISPFKLRLNYNNGGNLIDYYEKKYFDLKFVF